MIRRVQMRIDYANQGKLAVLDRVLEEAVRVVNLYIVELWDKDECKFVTFKVDTWLSARMQQCLGKQASGIVRSAKARVAKGKKASMPVMTRKSIDLDSRFVEIDIKPATAEFDAWIRLGSIGERIRLSLPTKKHRHFHKFAGWTLSKSVRLRKVGPRYYIDLFFEKDVPEAPDRPRVGVDCGYKRLIATSTGNIYGEELENVYIAISRAKRGSKRYHRLLTLRDNLIGKFVNEFLREENPGLVVRENLLYVKHRSKKKKRISTKFMSKLQRWSYRKTFQKLGNKCEEAGVPVVDVPPRNTSRTCPKCGTVDKSSRRGLVFTCVSCGYEADADTNAAVNILNLAAYSSRGRKTG